jgi:uncharacterized membrane protein
MDNVRPVPGWARMLEGWVMWGLRHWLWPVNGLVLLYGGIPWLSPLAYAAGHPDLGRFLFLIYKPFCHQIPERSFFLYGYQVAFCERETAMYTSLLLFGLLFPLVRGWIKPASLRVGGLLLLPMLLDGGTHMIDDIFHLGFRMTGDEVGSLNFWLRMLTGVLFAIAVAIAIYPRLDRDLRAAGLRA